MFLDWELLDLNQKVLTRLDGRRGGGKVDVGLNKKRLAEVPLSLEDPAHKLAKAVKTVLRATLYGENGFSRRVFTGRVIIPEGDRKEEGEQLVLKAADPMFQLESTLIRKAVGAVWEALVFAGIDQSEIMWQLIASGAGLGIGKGVLPASVKRDRTYPPGKDVASALIQMSEVIEGPDFELVPNPVDSSSLVNFTTYFPRQGSDLSAAIKFVHGARPYTAQGFKHSPAGDAIANVLLAVGAPREEATEASPFGVYPAYLAQHAASIAEFGRFERMVQFEDVVETPTLESHAKALLSKLAFPVDYFDFDAAPERWETETGDGLPPEFGRDYWIGDTIGCEAHLPGLSEVLQLKGRVTDASLVESQPGQLMTKLTCAPELSFTGITGEALTLKVPEGV